MTLEPIHQTVTVHCGIAHAFDVFTTRMGDWWPARGHSMGEDQIETIVIEGRVGGRIFERWRNGEEASWGEVTVWDPPRRLALSWMPNPTAPAATEVDVEFEAVSDASTRVRLTHSAWERFGEAGPEKRDQYEQGWPQVLAAFVGRATDPECQRAFARQTNQLVWSLLADEERSPEADDHMLDAAHASAYHWSVVGGDVEAVRAQWLISHVNAVLGRPVAATHHAALALSICERAGLGDFDLAYAYEGVARAAAVGDDGDTAATWRAKAADAGGLIAADEDRTLFEADLVAGPWEPLSR